MKFRKRIRLSARNYSLVVGSFKSAVSKQIRKYISDFQWQKSYFEHIIRTEKELFNIHKYINTSPIKCNI